MTPPSLIQRLWRGTSASFRRARGIDGPVGEFINAVFRGNPPTRTPEILSMLDAYRAELSEEISGSVRAIRRWSLAIILGVAFLAIAGNVLPAWIANVARGGLLGAAFGLLGTSNGVFQTWSRRRQVDVCLENARWVLNRATPAGPGRNVAPVGIRSSATGAVAEEEQ